MRYAWVVEVEAFVAEVPAWTRELPLGGWMAGWVPWMGEPAAAELLAALRREIAWGQRTIVMAGREVMQPRLVAWYGDPEAVYTYSGRRNDPLPWTPALADVRDRIAATVGVRFD